MPVSPVGFPQGTYRPGIAGITILVITAVAPPPARRAVGAAVEIARCGSVGRVVGASPAAGGRGAGPPRSGSSRGGITPPLSRVQLIPEIAIRYLPAQDVEEAHGDSVVGGLVAVHRVLAPAGVEGVHQVPHGGVVRACQQISC